MARKPRVVWTARALRDLETIGDYIAEDRPKAAQRWVATLMKTAELAAVSP
jgi:plasmid stabilization system protein ParE